MEPFFWRRRGSHQPLLRRLDRAAERLNPFLMMIAIGLAVLNISCLITLVDTGTLAIHHGAPDPPPPPGCPSATHVGPL